MINEYQTKENSIDKLDYLIFTDDNLAKDNKSKKKNDSTLNLSEKNKNGFNSSNQEKEKKISKLPSENAKLYNKKENEINHINHDLFNYNNEEELFESGKEADLNNIELRNNNAEINELYKNELMDNKSDINKYNSQIKKVDNFEFQTKYGFANIGNTCYMNSFLQILFHTPGFLNTLKKIKEEGNVDKSLINNLINLSEEPTNTKYLKNIKSLMGEVENSFGDYCQNDSQEFGVGLIDEIIRLIKGKLSFSEEKKKEIEITPQNQKEISMNFSKNINKNILMKK